MCYVDFFPLLTVITSLEVTSLKHWNHVCLRTLWCSTVWIWLCWLLVRSRKMSYLFYLLAYLTLALKKQASNPSLYIGRVAPAFCRKKNTFRRFLRKCTELRRRDQRKLLPLMIRTHTDTDRQRRTKTGTRTLQVAYMARGVRVTSILRWLNSATHWILSVAYRPVRTRLTSSSNYRASL